MSRRLLSVVLALALLPTWPLSGAELSGPDLIAALRAGGYNIYFRHAATDWSDGDRVEGLGDWTSCEREKMRQLSDEGRQSARAVGAAMRALGIPVAAVLSSEYCRAA